MIQISALHDVDVRFVFRKYQGKNPKLRTHGTIYAVITMNGEDSEPFSTQEQCWKSEWMGTKRLFSDKNRNVKLNKIREYVRTVANILEMQGEKLSAYKIKQHYFLALQGGKTPQWTILEAFDKYKAFKEQQKKVIGDTITTYETRKNYLGQYLTSKGRKNVLVKDFSLKDFNNLEVWGLSQGTGQDYVSKVRQMVKSVLKFAKREGQTIDEAIMFERLTWERPKTPTYVEEEAIAKIQAVQLPEHLEKVFDAWLFARHTCLHFVDYYYLQADHIKNGFIIKSRQKTGILQRVPLNEVAYGLIEKYEGVEGLPKVSNKDHKTALALVNRYLSDICLLAGVKKFTFSNARDTYLNEAFNEKGVRPATENSIAGWTSQRESSRYRQVSLATIRKELGMEYLSNG
ncbi:MAG: hypothetical protein LCH91_05120 [Bacteroidetes bacterium]|nr:hypothetical protein [Bacteroidota bacterium]